LDDAKLAKNQTREDSGLLRAQKANMPQLRDGVAEPR
jgi:hypothetical protein